MSRVLTLFAVAFALTLGAGCKKEGAAGTESKGTESKGGETKKDEPAASGDKIGIAVCDEYLEKFGKCIPKLPAPAQGAMKQSLETTRTAWKAALTAGTKEALTKSCQMTLDSNKKTMTQCEW